MTKASRTSEPEADAPAADPRKVEIVGTSGEPLGYSFTLKDDLPEPSDPEEGQTPEAARLDYLAKSIAGWSSFHVDGEKYAFSQARAVALFTRFPHIAAQVERAISKDDK